MPLLPAEKTREVGLTI